MHAMKMPVFTAIGIIMLFTTCLSAADDAEELRATERERLRSLVDGDMETAGRLHADDFQLINPLGGTVTKAQYLGGIASGDIDYVEWEPDEITIRMYDEAAVMQYRAHLKIIVKGLPDAPSGNFWHTDLYEKRNGVWQVVWSQATQIRE